MKGAPRPPLPPEQAALKRMYERPFAPPDPLRPADLVLAALLALAALGLRWLHLGAPSLWADEGATLLFAQADWPFLWTRLPAVETNPPGYYALVKIWTGLAGISEQALRMPGALAGAAAVAAIYLAGQRVFGRGAAIVAATVLALSAVQVAHAQEARAYAFLSLGTALGLWLGHLALVPAAPEVAAREGGAPGRVRPPWPAWPIWAGLAITAGALPHLHYSGFFVALVLLVYLLALGGLRGAWGGAGNGGGAGGRARRRGLGLAVLGAALIALPPVWWTLGHIGAGPGDDPAGWMHPPSLAEAKWVIHETFGHPYLSFAAPGWAAETLPDARLGKLFAPRRLAEAVLAALAIFGMWHALRARQKAVPALALALGLIVVLFWLISQAKPIMLQRTLLFGLPYLALLMGYAVMALRHAYLVFPAALALFGFQAANLAAYYPKAQKEDWRGTIRALQRAHGPDAAIVLASGPYLPASVSSAPLLRFYWTGPDPAPVFVLPAARAQALDAAGRALQPDLRPLAPAAPHRASRRTGSTRASAGSARDRARTRCVAGSRRRASRSAPRR